MKTCYFKILLFALSCFGSMIAQAQVSATTYAFTAFSGTFTEITGGTNVAPGAPYSTFLADDAYSAAIPLGFTFNYCGIDYTQVVASTNGWVSFNASISGSSYLTNSQTELNSIKPALMPLWDDLGGQSGPAATYITTGTAPNRVFTLEYKNWKWTFGSSATISIQVKLFESTNIVQYVYRQEANTNTGTTASIGICDGAGTPGFISLENTTASPTVSTTTLAVNLNTRPLTNQVYQFKPIPPIDMRVDSIILATPFCSNSMQPVSVRVRNDGTATIDSVMVQWELDGVAQPSVMYNMSQITNIATEPNNYAIVPLGDVFFPDFNPREVKAWTYRPNDLDDEVPLNDTLAGPLAATLLGVDVVLPADTTICEGQSISIDAGVFPGNPIYVWNTGDITQNITADDAGIYTVMVQNSDGCLDRDTMVIDVDPLPTANSIAIIDNGGCSYTFNIIAAQNIDDYEWSFGDGTTGPGPGPKSHTYGAPGQYTVTVTMSNACGEITLTKLVVCEDGGTSIEETDIANLIKVFPNPASKEVSVTYTEKMDGLSIYNVLGQRVYQSGAAAEKYTVNVSGLAAGLYHIVAELQGKQVNKVVEIVR